MPAFEANEADDALVLRRVLVLALEAEARGNLPIAAVVTHGSKVVAEAVNKTRSPAFHPGKHAEVEALRLVPASLWARCAGELTLYTSLEPCLMCFGSLVIHGVGRVVYGAPDPLGGATALVPNLPTYVRSKAEAIRWVGPAAPDVFGPLADRALALAGGVTRASGAGVLRGAP